MSDGGRFVNGNPGDDLIAVIRGELFDVLREARGEQGNLSSGVNRLHVVSAEQARTQDAFPERLEVCLLAQAQVRASGFLELPSAAFLKWQSIRQRNHQRTFLAAQTSLQQKEGVRHIASRVTAVIFRDALITECGDSKPGQISEKAMETV